jgi:hypothetical protein
MASAQKTADKALDGAKELSKAAADRVGGLLGCEYLGWVSARVAADKRVQQHTGIQ